MPSEYFTIEEAGLRISGLIRDDEGVYQCQAENDYGNAQAHAQLVVHQAGEFEGNRENNIAPSTPTPF